MTTISSGETDLPEGVIDEPTFQSYRDLCGRIKRMLTSPAWIDTDSYTVEFTEK